MCDENFEKEIDEIEKLAKRIPHGHYSENEIKKAYEIIKNCKKYLEE